MKKHNISKRTILVPLLFMIIHLLTSAGVMLGFSLVLVVISALQNQSMPVDMMMDESTILAYTPYMVIAYSIVQIIIYGIWLSVKQRKEFPRYVFDRKGKPGHWLLGTIITVGCIGLTNLFFILLELLSESVPFIARLIDEYADTMTMLTTPEHWLVKTLYLAVLVPIAEEMLFRGIIMAELKRAMPQWIAIVVNGLLFAAFHIQPIQSIYVFIVGMVIAAAYLWSESFALAVFMHMLFNFLGGVLPDMVNTESQAYEITMIVFIAFTVIAIAATVWFYLSRRYQPEDFFAVKRFGAKRKQESEKVE